MGNTTIIELDHDLAGEIEKDPLGFIEVVIDQLRCGRRTGQPIPGGRIIAMFPRYLDSSPQYAYWEAWKKRWIAQQSTFTDE